MRTRTIQALLIPANTEHACQVIEVRYSAAALSDAIGGGLLDDLYYGDLKPHIDHRGASARFCFYADQDRAMKGLPVNVRAEVLAARLDCIGDLRSVSLAGDVLVIGATSTNDDADVPDEVLSASRLAGLTPHGRNRTAWVEPRRHRS